MSKLFLRSLFAAVALTLRGLAAEPIVQEGDLPRIAPTPPEKAISTFKLRPGIKIELVAAEPLVMDPIAIAFDEFNRLYAVEMRDYSERFAERLGRIRLLEDGDGDGVMEQSSVFADNLGWPTGVIAYDGGVFVIATPDVLYLKDTDGDKKADVRRIVFTGLGSQAAPINVQQLANSLTWSLDNRIHVATGGNGGELRQPHQQGPVINLRFHDFSFDPRTLDVRLETGGGQYGITFDDYGRKFICNNSSHIRQVMYDQSYITPAVSIPLSEAAISIAKDGAAAEVFRTSPDEPWRVLRTRWRVAGVVPGPIEGGGRASGYFTSATGLAIYRGDALGSDFSGDAFVADCGSNLVHRKKIKPNGVPFLAERAADEAKSEFLTSSDTWFRPVQLANGPDGALYIVDMYRELIEHPWSIPKAIKDRVDLNRGNDRGRIYRVTSSDFKRSELPLLAKAKTETLAQLLSHPNGWTRDTAARLLYERQDKSAVRQLREPQLEPVGRLHAMHTLKGLGSLTSDNLLAGVKDNDPNVRENALKLTETVTWTGFERADLTNALARLAHDPSSRVQHQLIWTLTKFTGQIEWNVLLNVLTNSTDKWVQNAGRAAINIFLEKRAYPLPRPPFHAWTFKEYMRASGVRGSEQHIEAAKLALGSLTTSEGALALSGVAALLSSPDRRAKIATQLASSRVYQKLLQESSGMLTEGSATNASVLADAITVVASDSRESSQRILLGLLAPGTPYDLQRHALDALLGKHSSKVPASLWDIWPRLTPQLRTRALDSFLRSPSLTEQSLEAALAGKASSAEFTPVQRAAIQKSPSDKVQELYKKVFTLQQSPAREVILSRLSPSLKLTGEPDAGRKIYTERCASCHKLRGEGTAVGPDLESIKSNGAEYFLMHVIDPNREVSSRYVAYSLQLRSGETYSGIITDENAATITLREANGETRTLSREFIHNLQADGKSLMPEGLEDGLAPQDFANLTAYILK